jgi:hypothetical protein
LLLVHLVLVCGAGLARAQQNQDFQARLKASLARSEAEAKERMTPLLGKWRLDSQCQQRRITLDMEFRKVETLMGAARVQGVASTTGGSEANKDLRIESLVTGSLNPETGLLTLQGMPRGGSSDRDYCLGTLILGRCIKPLTMSDTAYQELTAGIAANSMLHAQLVRSESGGADNSLGGTVVGKAFGCSEVRLSRSDGKPLPPMAPATAATEKAAMDAVGEGGVEAPGTAINNHIIIINKGRMA